MKRVHLFVIALSFAPAWPCKSTGSEISKQYENSILNAPKIDIIRGQFIIPLDST